MQHRDYGNEIPRCKHCGQTILNPYVAIQDHITAICVEVEEPIRTDKAKS